MYTPISERVRMLREETGDDREVLTVSEHLRVHQVAADLFVYSQNATGPDPEIAAVVAARCFGAASEFVLMQHVFDLLHPVSNPTVNAHRVNPPGGETPTGV